MPAKRNPQIATHPIEHCPCGWDHFTPDDLHLNPNQAKYGCECPTCLDAGARAA